MPHDSAHVGSAYSTTVQGELLVSTFTAAMHHSEGMSGHILPVIFSWHMGIVLNPLAGSAKGAFDGEKFWRAWERGRMATLDTFGPDWDFWGLVETPRLTKLRSWMRPTLRTECRARYGRGHELRNQRLRRWRRRR